MRKATKTALELLGQAEWFSNVGVADSDEVDFVCSWSEAIAICDTPETASNAVERANLLRHRVQQVSWDLYNVWNDITDTLKPLTEPLVAEKTAEVMATLNLPKVFLDQVRWDILLICQETEYSLAVPIDRRIHLLPWYVSGHFPCGWRGDFPAGRLIVL